MKNLIKTKWFTFATYLLLVLATLLVGYVLMNNNKTLNSVITAFFTVAENRSFDYRQRLKISHNGPTANKDIVVLAIDDASLELLWDKYGEWPIPRNVYADVINHIENQKPRAIIFDLMFIKSIRATGDADKALVDTMNKYDNIYTAMTFDDQPADVRKPINLPDRLAINIENNSNINIKNKYGFSNCRAILPEIINGKTKIGIANVIRNSDGIIRKVAPVLAYKDKYYPSLTFEAAVDYITGKENKNFVIDKKSNLIVENTKIPLTPEGETILNWYGTRGSHTVYPMYKVITDMTNNKNSLELNNKIIIIGTTAMSLHDTKSVPVQDSVYPGVEVHATFLNNLIDNNFIKQTNFRTNAMIVTLVVSLVGFIVMLSTSTVLVLNLSFNGK